MVCPFLSPFASCYFFYISKEQSYDQFPANKNRLYRFESTSMYSSDEKVQHHLLGFLTSGDDVNNALVTPLIVGRDLQHNFPEVKSITRFQDQGEGLVKVSKAIYKTKHIVYADHNFFKNLSLHFIVGNRMG